MKGRTFPCAVAAALILLLGATTAASALELGAQGWAGDLGFSQTRSAIDTTLPGQDYFWGWSLSAAQAITDNLSFEADVGSDPLLRNVAYAFFTYKENFLSVGIGPFFGFFNDTSTLLKSGISTAIRLEAPSIAFISFRSDSSISGELLLDGDYLQNRNEITFGFYVPNAICSLSLATRQFEQKQGEETVIDQLTEYAFSTDIYQKNVPYRIVLTFSYQDLSRSFVNAATVSTLDSIVVGAEIDITLAKAVTLQTGFDAAVYSFGRGALTGSDSNFLFRAIAGVRVDVQ
jgi:hypothetical protein